jgi:phosphomevalonate kinase
VTREQLLSGDAPEGERVWSIAWHTLQVLDCSTLPAGGDARFDTRGFQDRASRGKLGLGSSAALCVASYAAFSEMLCQPTSYTAALDVHRRFQGGAGSGIDVAAAWFGGVVKFRRPGGGSDDPGEAEPWSLPTGMAPTFVFSGAPARTSDHLMRLRRWLEDGGGSELDALAAASAALFETRDLMAALERYVATLWELDQAAVLGIFSAAHRRLRQLAFDAGVVYKPCGAGGGDIGAAFTPDAAAAERFVRLARANGFLPLALETAPHGIEVTR